MSQQAAGKILAHGEEQLATATGIARTTLAEARIKTGLAEGTDWALVKGAILLTKNAVGKLMKGLGLEEAVDLEQLAAETDVSQKNGAAVIVQGKVAKLYLNKHVLGVEVEGRGLVRVRVKDSAKFQRGMVVPIVPEAGGEVWRLGRREPRSFGRW